MLLKRDLLQTKFDQAMPFAEFTALADTLGQRAPWDERYGRLELTSAQHDLLGSFTREMNILCLTGTWCGDCALQGSALARIADANPEKIHLRFLQREESQADLIVSAQINAGFRVPVTWFMAEDFEPASVFGDRTLSRYRAMAGKQLPPGAVTITAAPPDDPVRAVLDELVDEIERVHLLLRTSTRLRQKHDD